MAKLSPSTPMTDQFEVVDTDDFAAEIEERPSGVARVDLGGRLDQQPALDEPVGQADDSL